MRRAGVFTGVDRTGQLQTLNDAAAGVERMHRSALGQGMSDGTQAILITRSRQEGHARHDLRRHQVVT